MEQENDDASVVKVKKRRKKCEWSHYKRKRLELQEKNISVKKESLF